jgi:hypothetical protein
MSVKVEPIFDGGCGRQGPTRQPTSRSRSLEEVEVVRLLRRAEDKVVEPVRVVADEDAPAVGLDPAEDDGRGAWRSRPTSASSGPTEAPSKTRPRCAITSRIVLRGRPLRMCSGSFRRRRSWSRRHLSRTSLDHIHHEGGANDRGAADSPGRHRCSPAGSVGRFKALNDRCRERRWPNFLKNTLPNRVGVGAR